MVGNYILVFFVFLKKTGSFLKKVYTGKKAFAEIC